MRSWSGSSRIPAVARRKIGVFLTSFSGTVSRACCKRVSRWSGPTRSGVDPKVDTPGLVLASVAICVVRFRESTHLDGPSSSSHPWWRFGGGSEVVARQRVCAPWNCSTSDRHDRESPGSRPSAAKIKRRINGA